LIISHKYKFIFIKTRKTAGTSIEIYLSNICDKSDIFTPIIPAHSNHKPRNYKGIFNPFPEIWDYRFNNANKTIKELFKKKKFYNHISARKIKARVKKNIWNNYYKFCFERNPWDKTVSHYYSLKYLANQKLTWQKYFENQFFCMNYPIYTDSKNDVIVDKIVKYENLNQDLDNIFSKLNIPFNGKLNIQSKSTFRKEKEHYKYKYSKKEK